MPENRLCFDKVRTEETAQERLRKAGDELVKEFIKLNQIVADLEEKLKLFRDKNG